MMPWHKIMQKKEGVWTEMGVTENDMNSKQNTSSLESDVASKGFTKNVGTITGISMNGGSKGTSGNVDLGTVITEHQDITGKQDKSNLDTTFDSPSDTKYPSTLATKNALDGKQDAFGSATDGQSIRYNATTGKWEPFSIPSSMYIREPKTGDEIGAITPSASINGELRYCTTDGVTYSTFKAGNFYLCTTADGTTYGWFSMGSFVDLSAYQLKNLGSNDKAVITDASGNISASSISSTELGYLSGLTGNAQTQLDGKQKSITMAVKTILSGAGNWTYDGSNFYTQDIAYSGMTASSVPVISAIYNGATKENVSNQKTAASKIVKIISATDKLTVYATEATATDLTIQVMGV